VQQDAKPYNKDIFGMFESTWGTWNVTEAESMRITSFKVLRPALHGIFFEGLNED
jgi:hypothetical protein